MSKAFTLIEVLVSILIVGLVAVASYSAFFVLSQANQASRNRLQALTLSQATLEEIKTQARNQFENLENIYPASFVAIDAEKYPGFDRRIVITALSSLFKRADVTIQWVDRANRVRQYNLAALISKPPESLRANIYGRINNVNTGALISGATVTATQENLSPFSTLTDNNLECPLHPEHNGHRGYNYHFCDAAGNFQLPTGNWNFNVSADGYHDFGPMLVAGLSSGEDRQVNVQLIPLPKPAHIKGRFIWVGTSNYISNLPVVLYQKGTPQGDGQLNASTGFDFGISFQDTDPKCFTVASQDAYKVGACGNFRYPCSSTKNYNHLGWSSSVNSAAECGNPWEGNANTDTRICVSPGDTNNRGDIPLSNVPRATLNGHVYNSSHNPVKGAQVEMLWWDGTPNNPHFVTSKADGSYTASVFAQQELFPDDKAHYLRAQACASLPIIICCGRSGSQSVCSPVIQVGPIYSGNTLSQDFTLPATTNATCGSADGYVRYKTSTGSGIGGVKVSIAGSINTDGTGYYLFQCSGGGYSLNTGSYSVVAEKSGYYTFESGGNWVYSSRGDIQIKENQKTIYETIRLWPIGLGTIHGRVVLAGSDPVVPISGVIMNLDYYSDGSIDQTTTTDGTGIFVFKNVQESLPPFDARGNPYYTQGTRNHSLKLTPSSEYTPKTLSNIALNDGQNKDLGDIGLALAGQM